MKPIPLNRHSKLYLNIDRLKSMSRYDVMTYLINSAGVDEIAAQIITAQIFRGDFD